MNLIRDPDDVRNFDKITNTTPPAKHFGRFPIRTIFNTLFGAFLAIRSSRIAILFLLHTANLISLLESVPAGCRHSTTSIIMRLYRVSAGQPSSDTWQMTWIV